MTCAGDIADLLDVAREALRNDILPALAPERRYVALMVAHAMAIAARECALGEDAYRREAARLGGLAGDVPAPAEPAAADLPALRRAVSAAIRDGRFDDPAHAEALVAALVDIVSARVAISQPRALRE
jgi:hypothetical protein